MELIASCTENCECICSVFVQPESVLYYCRVIILILYSWKFRIIVSVAKACHFMLRCVDFSLSQQICKCFQLLCQYNCNYYHYYYTLPSLLSAVNLEILFVTFTQLVLISSRLRYRFEIIIYGKHETLHANIWKGYNDKVIATEFDSSIVN